MRAEGDAMQLVELQLALSNHSIQLQYFRHPEGALLLLSARAKRSMLLCQNAENISFGFGICLWNYYQLDNCVVVRNSLSNEYYDV